MVEAVGVTITGSGLVGREGALASRRTGAIAYRLPREGRMGSTLSLHSGLRRVGIGVCVCVCVCARCVESDAQQGATWSYYAHHHKARRGVHARFTVHHGPLPVPSPLKCPGQHGRNGHK